MANPPILELGPAFYDPVQPAVFPMGLPRYQNESAALMIGLSLSADEWKKYFLEFKAYPDNLPQPLALRYHGHQFRHYNPDLGDGRGFLYAQFRGPDHKLYDLGTKGSGQTPYSRSGDGRLTLKGAFREALATELLESLGVNTSKTFCFFETGEHLERGDEPSPTRAAVLTRLSHSHLRIGTFQRLATLGEAENLVKLVDYSVQNYFPELLTRASLSSSQPLARDSSTSSKLLTNTSLSTPELCALIYRQVCENLAGLAAQYMIAGFVHGVLNSDNMNITGESFDYGPYRFLPHYDLSFTAAYFDRTGLYSFGRQPQAIHWNVLQLGRALQVAHPSLPVEEILGDFGEIYGEQIRTLFFRRLNLVSQDETADGELINQFFDFLQETKAPYEQVFFDLHSGVNSDRLNRSPLAEIYSSEKFAKLKELLLASEIADVAKAQHPYFQNTKPCTLLIEEIEELWSHIAKDDNWHPFQEKLNQIRNFRGLYKLFE